MQGTITKNWDKYLDQLTADNRDIYFTERYARLYESPEAVAEAFIFQDGEKVYLLPYIRREIKISGKSYFDFETPYGYGGPLANTRDRSFIEAAFREFRVLAAANRMIAGFIRFHPLLKNHALAGAGCDVVFDRKTVAIDLRENEEEIWNKDVHSHHRTSIRKAEKSGLQFRADVTLAKMDEFVAVYNRVLNHLNGDDFYRFDNGYYRGLKDKLAQDSFLGLVYLNDKIISAIIFFLYGDYGHAHLGGSLAEYFEYCPNNFLFFKAALYLKSRGVKFFHFGGGTDNSKDNSLYRFKRRLSRNEFDFYIGKMVLNELAYQEACAEWENKNPDKAGRYKNFLLKYRY